jgi:FkbM family methyltransferase
MHRYIHRFYPLIPRKVKNYLTGLRDTLSGEQEIRLLPDLCQRDAVSLDIGAHGGSYTYFLRKYSKACYSFEPNPDLATFLAERFSGERDVHICPVALSDREGLAELCIPVSGGMALTGLSTIDPGNTLHNLPVRKISVRRMTLDGLGIRDVGFIKIDVEGHTCAVLRGGKGVIERDHPHILMEIDYHHNPETFSSIFSFMEKQGYAGYFMVNGTLHSLLSFDRAAHQDVRNLNDTGTAILPGHGYINNFIFMSPTRSFGKIAVPVSRNRDT